MKRSTAVILAALVVTVAACKKQNDTNVTEETPAAAPAPAPAAAPESAAAAPATTTPAMDSSKMGGMNMSADTGKKAEKKMEKKEKK